MTHEGCESYRELLAANALTALDADDARTLGNHLESCAECRSESGKWDETAALLALGARPLEPSAQVRDRILAGIRAGDRAERPAPPRVSNVDPRVLDFERPRRDVWTSLRSFGAIAATLVIVALIVSLMILWQQRRATQNELARLSRELRDAQTELAHQRAMAELLTSPNGHMAKLTGTDVAPSAQAMLAYDKSGHAMLMAKGLPAAPNGMAYQLWYIKDNQKMPGKVFTADARGNGMLEDQVPMEARDKAVFAITLEPESGVQSPTGSIYLVSAS